MLLSAVSALMPLSGCSVPLKPLNETEMLTVSSVNAERTTMAQEPISGPIGLHEAMARALKYNLDYRLEMMQQALRAAETDLATTQMLPEIVANAGYSGRDRNLIVSSLDIASSTPFEPNTVSQEREFNADDVTFSWDILDFALSYVRAKQASDKFLIAQETKRKVIQRIIEDTRTAFWRAVSADRMAKKLAQLGMRVQRAISGSRRANSEGAQSPLTALSYERELVQIRRTAEELEHELNLAKSQLAALMNVAPGTKFTVVDEGGRADPKVIGMSTQEMVAEAIFNRPEIREIAYKKRITEEEANAAILELLPNIKQYGMDAFNDNRFLLNNNWLGWGATVAGNLMKIVQLPERQAVIDAAGEVVEQQALAMTMVVMTQVYVSRTRYTHFADELATAKQYVEVQGKLVDQLRAEAGAGSIGDQTLIREEMNLLVAEVERDIAIADLENASANLVVSMGLDLQAKEVNLGLGVKELAGELKVAWADRVSLSDRGKYLLEIEKARQEALRKQEEIARLAREEARRIAEEAQRVKDEEIRRVKEEARVATEESARAKAEQERIAKEEARRLKDEAQAAKEAAEKEKAEQLRVAQEEVRRAKAEAREAKQAAEQEKAQQLKLAKQEVQVARDEARKARAEEERSRDEARREREAGIKQAALEAKRAKDETRSAARSEAERLKEEAKAARDEARRARHDAISSKARPTASSGPTWKWVWPWEESEAEAKASQKPRHPRRASKD